MGLGHSTRPAGGEPPAGRAAADLREAVLPSCNRDADAMEARLRVEIGPDRVTIRRSIAGLDAYVNVPTQSYRGAALREATGGVFEIALVHLDPNLEIVLARTSDDSDLIALWRDYARRLALPLLAEDAEGRLCAMEGNGARSPFARRRGSPLKNRRPRFLARRMTTLAGAAII